MSKPDCDAELISVGSLMDGPLNPSDWEVWLGNDQWRNADDMLDHRPGYGSLAGVTNGVRVVARRAIPETRRLPRTVRQQADDLIDAGAKSVTLNDLTDEKGASGTAYPNCGKCHGSGVLGGWQGRCPQCGGKPG